MILDSRRQTGKLQPLLLYRLSPLNRPASNWRPRRANAIFRKSDYELRNRESPIFTTIPASSGSRSIVTRYWNCNCGIAFAQSPDAAGVFVHRLIRQVALQSLAIRGE